ncbi:FAD-binding oxidoreductase [Halovulum sp. GXIMD14793]
MPLKHDTYTGWGRVLTATGDIARPERGLSSAAGPAQGNRRSYGDAALNNDGVITDMTRMDRFLSFDAEAGLLEAEAGIKLSEILRLLAPKGWMPAVLPGTAHATLGGAIASDVHGKNHHAAGSFGEHVESLTLIGADGTNQTVLPDTALFRATVGGMGQTGIIASAKIKLAPCPSGFVELTERRINALTDFLAAFDASEAPFNVGWIDATAKGEYMGRGILEEAHFGASKEPYHPKLDRRSVPFNAPRFAMAKPIVKMFNTMYWRRVPEGGRIKSRSLDKLFFPLDGISDWNRLYGKRGFHQFQCVVPFEPAPDVLRDMLQAIGESGLASPLAVLKKLGAGRAGMLSFPMEGYTLAVDFPNRDTARDLVKRLIDMTKAAEGRIYFTKDSLATAAQVAGMYPEMDDWRAAVRDADPKGTFVTDLVRRLELRGEA